MMILNFLGFRTTALVGFKFAHFTIFVAIAGVGMKVLHS